MIMMNFYLKVLLHCHEILKLVWLLNKHSMTKIGSLQIEEIAFKRSPAQFTKVTL